MTDDRHNSLDPIFEEPILDREGLHAKPSLSALALYSALALGMMLLIGLGALLWTWLQ